jgi:hypothetical protein
LIAAAIQGITPDARDIASPLAMRLLCPALIDHHGFCDEDDSPDDICEVARDLSVSRVRQRANPWRAAGLRQGAPIAGILRSDAATGSKARHNSLPVPDLLRTICRLVC